jgi:hypothetical protein
VKEKFQSKERKEKKFFGLTFFKIYDIIIIVKKRKRGKKKEEKVNNVDFS